jgi:hypothetical protein
VLEWVSLLTSKKRYSEVSKYYEDKVLKRRWQCSCDTNIIRDARFCTKVINASANGLGGKFYEKVNHNNWLISCQVDRRNGFRFFMSS